MQHVMLVASVMLETKISRVNSRDMSITSGGLEKALATKKTLCLHSYETTMTLFGKAYHIKAPVPEHMLQALAVAAISLPMASEEKF